MSTVCTLPPILMHQFQVRYHVRSRHFYLEEWQYDRWGNYQPVWKGRL